jgi:hypothetical protein
VNDERRARADALGAWQATENKLNLAFNCFEREILVCSADDVGLSG